jgi:hypothetical protein
MMEKQLEESGYCRHDRDHIVDPSLVISSRVGKYPCLKQSSALFERGNCHFVGDLLRPGEIVGSGANKTKVIPTDKKRCLFGISSPVITGIDCWTPVSKPAITLSESQSQPTNLDHMTQT